MLPLALALFLAFGTIYLFLKWLKGWVIRYLYKNHPGFKKIRPFLPF